MNSKKLLISMIITISILLFLSLIIGILNLAGIDVTKFGKAKNSGQPVVTELATIDANPNNGTIEEQVQEQEAWQKQQNINLANANTDSTRSNYLESSRSSSMNRELYVNLEDNGVDQDYVELKTYIPLSEVKISFNMDVSKPTGLSREDFIELVSKMRYDRTGILEANAGVIWDCCQKYNVNEIFVLGICGIESAWCSAPQHQRTHNYASLMSKGKLIPYASDAAGFEALIKLLGQNYLTPGKGVYHGKTITGVGTSYCNTTTWPPKVYKCMQQVFQ